MATVLFMGLVVLGGLIYLGSQSSGSLTPISSTPPRRIDPATTPAGPARAVAELLQNHAPILDAAPEQEIYVAVRSKGRRLGEGTFPLKDGYQATTIDAVAVLTNRAGAAAAAEVDAVEVCLPYDFRDVRMRAKRGVQGNVHRGMRGVRFSHGGQRALYCPTDMIARNSDFKQVQHEFARGLRIKVSDLIEQGEAEIFDAHQLLLQLGDKPRVHQLLRGNVLVPESAVNRETTLALTDGMARWLLHSLQPSGRMVYMYWPSRNRESNGNNMIRQFMASTALVRLGNYRDDPAITEAAERNYRYNLSKFYRTDGDLGMITFRNKSKLGAAALAALGIVEAPFRAELAEYEQTLVRFTDHMLRDNGRFYTFYKSDREDNHNFYPGETLLLWAFLMEKQPDPERLDRFMKSFYHYREWHRANTNPAFIPWHTQAYYMVWRHTRNEELRDFVFEMNDFLADFQQWDNVRYEDERGRYHDPERRNFGPPHASSTGVYLEGFIDAYKMAKEVGDEVRAERYRRAMLQGIRSLMQLQFVDDVDTYYVVKKDDVLGGIRTTVYNNTIRVDNVQHSLMGLMKLIPAFDKYEAW